MRRQDRERIQVEVASRIAGGFTSASDEVVENLIHDTLYHERLRLEKDSTPRSKSDRKFYQEVRQKMQHASSADLRSILEELARYFVAEVVGNFDERVYRLSTNVIPAGLSVLLNAMSPARLLSLQTLKQGLAKQLVIQGSVEQTKSLLAKGTLVVVPTHSSNLDSILLGYAVYLAGLPPLLYGAGLNLFSNPLISFFMRNLGAYRVDRTKQASLYKDVLKQYAQCSLEMGYHNLFFPGGTRSRSGEVEQKLKRGLLGTAINGYVHNLKAGKAKPNIYLVPATLSYKLVLEAETLIGDHLKAVGKSRYIIEDDEFSKPRRILNFMSSLVSLEEKIVLTFSDPMDIFGNPVDAEGRSLDPRGRIVDPKGYVCRDGVPIVDAQRDHQFTNEAAEEISRAYLRDNVVMSTNVVARAVLDLLREENPELDLYRLLRTGGNAASFPLLEVHKRTETLLAQLKSLPNGPRFGEELLSGDIQEIVADALAHFSIYHTQPAAVRRGDRLFHEDRNLLLYYGNRLEGYGLRLNRPGGQ